jgi:hypothetical protein
MACRHLNSTHHLPEECSIKLKLLPIAAVKDVTIHAPEASFVSFYNSPYYPHTSGTAVDIYINSRSSDFAPSPIEGRVKKIYGFTPPKSKYFPVHEKEQLLILESRGDTPLYTRLLHVAPSVKVGDRVSVGDELGLLIRSGFFNFWTDSHIHVDVRGSGNLIRAKGSLPIHPFLGGDEVPDFKGNVFEGLKVSSVTEDYVLLKARNTLKLGRFWGVACTVGNDTGLLDGGVPHYSCGGVYLPRSHSVKVGEKVRLGETFIGQVERIHGNVAYFRGVPLSVHVNQTRIRGLSLYLFLSDQKTIKLVLEEPMKMPLNRGEYVELSLQSFI